MMQLPIPLAGVPAFRAVAGAALLFIAAATKVLAAPPINEVVDIQYSLCDSPARIERALDLPPPGPAINVWLFDDAALALFTRGLRIRLRETKRGAELTLKAADQDCLALPAGTAPAGEGKCEYDLHGTKIAGALSLTRAVDSRTAQDLVAGRQSLASELSAAQKRFLEGVPGAWPLPAAIRALGPTHVRSYRTHKMPYAVDISVLPDDERFIEISRKVAKAESASARARFEADLAKAGVSVCADQSAQAINKLHALLKRQ